MDSLEIIHQVESRVGYTLPSRIFEEIRKHGDNDVQYIIELYGLPTVTSDKEKRPSFTEVTTVLTHAVPGSFDQARKRIEWSSTIYEGCGEAREEADRIQAKQIEEAEEEIRKILS